MACKIKYNNIWYSEEEILKLINRRLEIKNIFESNPELVNQVYEALVPSGYTRLYRAENEKGVDSSAPQWLLEQSEIIAQKEAEGRWFYKSYEEAKYHADKFGSSGISYIDIPTSQVESFNAKNNKFGGGYAKDGKEYFVSRELANTKKSFEQQKQQAISIYSQYLESLNKPNTNPILQGNQAEQQKKFAELQERLNNKEFLEGAKYAYESSKGLQEWGTQEQYNDYIARVSLGIIKNPSSGEYNYESQVKDIVYHGSKSTFEQFSKDFLGSNLGQISPDSKLGFFFSNLENAKGFGKNIFTTILNMSNPKVVTEEEYTKLSGGTREFKNKVFSKLLNETKQENKDSLLADFRVSDYMGSEQYVVFEPEQIHILSSKKDIEGFREFVNNKQMFQKSSTNTQSPNAELESKIKIFLNKIGVKLETIGVGDFVAKADLINRIIQVVQGKADVTTLPEEAAHFFVDLLKANGTLYDQLVAEIDRNPIYQEVFDEYKNIYVTENGNPDINRIKEEAVGKLIAKNIVKIHQKDSNRSVLQRALDMIAAIIRKGLSAVGLENFSNLIKNSQDIDVYEQVASKILDADVSGLKLDLPSSNYEMLQKSIVTNVDIIDGIKKSQNLISEAKNKKVGVENIHYYSIFEGTPKAKDITITPSFVAGESSRKKNKYKIVTAKQEAEWKKVSERGTKVHAWAEEIVKSISLGRNLTDIYNKLSESDKKLYNGLEASIKELTTSILKEDSKATFLPEVRIYDPSFKWTDSMGVKHIGLAGSIDLLVVHGDGTVSIYDWKTTSKGKDLAAISVFKHFEYNMQIALYKRALMDGNYVMGVPRVKGIRKSRIVTISTESNSSGQLTKVDVAGQVPVAGERTTNERLNAKLDNLYVNFEKLMTTKPPSDEGERAIFYSRLNAIKDTLILLHTQKNFDKLLTNAKEELEYVRDILNENNPEIDDLGVADEITDMYADILDYVDRTHLTEALLSELRIIQDNANMFKLSIKDKRMAYMQGLANTYDLGKIDAIQRQMTFLSKNFKAASQQNHPMIALLYEEAKRALYKTEQESIALRLKTTEEVDKLRKWASGHGLSLQQAYDKIIDKKSGHLINQMSKEFYEAKTKAIENDDTSWFKENMELDSERYKIALEKYTTYITGKKYSSNPVKNKEKIQELISAFVSKHSKATTSGYIKIKDGKLSKWQSDEWKNLNKAGNEGLLDFYKYFTETTKELSSWLPGTSYKNNFIPSLRKTWVEEVRRLDAKTGSSLLAKLKETFTVNELTSNVDENTGEVGNQVPVYFVRDLGKDKSYDLGMVLQMFGEMSYNHKNMSEIEETAKVGLNLLSGMRAYKSSSFNPLGLQISPLRQEGEATEKANEDAIDLYTTLMNYYIYGVKTANPSRFSQMLDNLNKLTSHTLLGFSIFPAAAATVANIANTQIQAARGIYFNNSQYAKSMWMLSGGSVDKNTTETVAYLYKLFNAQIDQREVAKDRKLSSSIATRNLSSDLLYTMLRKPDEINQNLVFLSMLQNTIITPDGKFMLKSDYAKSLRPENYYNKAEVSLQKRKEIDKSIAEKLKPMKSVIELVKIENGKAYLEGFPNIDSEAVLGYRQMVRQVNKSIIGNMDNNDIFGAKTNVWARAILLFRNWMPRALTERFDSFTYNRELGRAEMGRYNTMFKMLFTIHKDEANKLRWAMAIGVEEAAKLEYLKQLRLNPEMADRVSEMEFIDLYKENMKAQWVGIGITIGVLLLLAILSKYYDDDEKTGMSKFTMKLAKRAYSEMAMFVNPIEALNILKSPTAATQPLVSVIKLFTHLGNEGWGQITGDEEMTKKATPLKYGLALTFLNGPSRFLETIDSDYEDFITGTEPKE